MPNRDRILVVEDDADSLTALFTLLTRAGYSVLTATNGSQAVDLFEHGLIPRLIVLDLMLPKVSGWQVLKYLGEDPRLCHTPVIITTALDNEEARAAGADLILVKPVDTSVLLREIARLVADSP